MMNKYRSSISLRLALIYTISSCIMLLFIIFSLYLLLMHRLATKKFEFLSNESVALQKILQTQPPNQISSQIREAIITKPQLYHYYVRIIDPTDHTIIATPGMNTHVPSSVFPNTTTLKPGQILTKRWRYYFLVSENITSSNHHPQLIQMATHLFAERTEHKMFIVYRRDMMLVWLISTLLAVIMGIMVSRKGLQPLRDMTQLTQRITITELGNRFNPADWPQELAILAQAFNSMLDRIEAGFTRLSRFSADLAHELRTPITNIMGEAEITLSRPRTNEEYRTTLESSLEELNRLTRMIESLLFLAQAENPHTAIHYVSIDVGKIFENLRDFYEATAEEKNIEMTSQGNISVTADPLLFRQALSNLVTNAIKYTPAGGSITLSAKKIDKEIHIIVTNTGVGIAAEHIPHLFDRFYRVDTARSHQTGGTGLGLAIVKSIMDLHHGRVLVNSEINKQTTFTLVFKDLPA